MKAFIGGLLLLALGGIGWLYYRDPMLESRVTTQRAAKPALPPVTAEPNPGWAGWPSCPKNELQRGFTTCAEFNNGAIAAQKHRDGYFEITFRVAVKTRHIFQILDGAITSAVEEKFQAKRWEVVSNLPLSLDATRTEQLWELEGFKGWDNVTPNKKRSGPKRPEQ